jgi:hypothetical protein
MVAQGDYKKILELVANWPAEDRAALAHDLLSLPARRAASTPQPRPSFALARGLGRVEGTPPPTDEQVRQWIDEYRMSKYGK